MKIRQEILKTNKQMNPLTSGPAEWGGGQGGRILTGMNTLKMFVRGAVVGLMVSVDSWAIKEGGTFVLDSKQILVKLVLGACEHN